MKRKLLLTLTIIFISVIKVFPQKSSTSRPNNVQAPLYSSVTCPLSVAIQDNNASAVCSELLKTLVAVTSACTDTNAVSYRWSSSVGGVFSTLRTTTFNLPEFLVATPVTFTVWVKEGNDSLSANYTITVKPRPNRPTLTPIGTIILCDNNSITLTSSACTGASTNVWSNGVIGVTSINVPAIGGAYFKVACEKNGCVSDSTAAVALITGLVTSPPITTDRIICAGIPITVGNGLQAQLTNCGNGASGTYTYTGGTVGYDQGYINTGGTNPTVIVPNTSNVIKKVSISVTWKKQKGGFQNDCGIGDFLYWPYHNETQFRVKSPSGKIITLVYAGTYGGLDNPMVTTVFEDGGVPVNSYSPPVSGTFAPAQPLSGFIGENPSGTWTLLPYDNYWRDPLCVSGFSLTLSESQNGTITWWDAPSGGNQVGTGSEFIPTNTAAGTYTYYVQGQCVRGCPSVRSTANLTIKPSPTAPVISISVPEVNGVRSLCYGESVTLSASGCNNGNTVSWEYSFSAPDRSGSGIASGSTYTFTPIGGNSYNTSYVIKAICEGTNLCRSVYSNSLALTVKYKPFAPSISGPGTSVCSNSLVTLTASGCSGGVMGWTGSRSGNSINFNLANTINIKAACTINGCTSDSSGVYTISPLARPVPPTVNASQVQALCYGASVNLSANCTNGTTVKWTGGLTGSPITVTPLSTRSYRASCLGTNGCPSDSSTALNIIVLPKTKPIITGNLFVCGVSSTTLTAIGCSGVNETVMWRDESTGTTLTETISQTKTFRAVCIRNGYCLSDSSDIFTVQYRVKPSQPSITPPPNTTVCQGTSVTLTASACAGGTLGWTGGLSGSSIMITSVGTKSYKVACTINGCTSDSSLATTVTVKVKPLQPTISSLGNTTVCQGASVVLSASACTDGTLGWTGGLSGSNITITSVGTKSYKVACTINGCTSDSSLATTVIINIKPSQPSITPPPNTTVCQGTSVTLTANSCTGGTLGWTGGLSGQTITVSPNFTKNYKVACTINGCMSDSSSAMLITVNPSPIITVNSNKSSICGGDTATLTAIGCTGTILWSIGATNPIIKVSPTINTTYTATCTLGFCSTSQQLTINTFATPNVTASGILQCGQTITLTANNVPSGSNIQWRKDGVDIVGATNSTLVVNSAGRYDFTSYKLQNTQTVSSINPNQVVYFVDKNVGFVINSGSIFKTRDGGDTWTTVYSVSYGPTIPLNSLTFTSPTIGWAVGNNGVCLKTVNGGDSWTYIPINTYFPLKKIKFKDSNNGVIVGDFGSIFTTTNGGNTWTYINTFNIALYPTFWGVTYVPNTANIYAVGIKDGGGMIAKSTNNGVTWSEITLGITSIPSNTVFNDITFTDSNNGFIIGDNGIILRTTNGGNNWQLQSNTVSSSFKEIQFLNSQVGYICGTFPNGSLLRTMDGGNTWKSLNMTAYPVSLSFVDENTGWITNYGNIIKYSSPQCSTIPAILPNNCCNGLETLKSGSWTDPTTWSCNRVPTSADDVFINTGHTITDSGNILKAKTLNYRGGILKIAATTNLRLVNP